jgi:invasion protein IalB
MLNPTLRGVLGLAVVLAALAQGLAPAFAQTATTDSLVATKTAWSVFADGSPKECWGVSKPKKTLNTRDGKEVSVKRSDILLFVTFRSGQVGGETSFAGGYPFAQGSTVELVIDDQTFQMTTRGEYAWAMTPEDDVKLLAAMQKGAAATLTARSAKGTQTQDTFSLSGFTAAMTEAASQCK